MIRPWKRSAQRCLNDSSFTFLIHDDDDDDSDGDDDVPLRAAQLNKFELSGDNYSKRV